MTELSYFRWGRLCPPDPCTASQGQVHKFSYSYPLELEQRSWKCSPPCLCYVPFHPHLWGQTAAHPQGGKWPPAGHSSASSWRGFTRDGLEQRKEETASMSLLGPPVTTVILPRRTISKLSSSINNGALIKWQSYKTVELKAPSQSHGQAGIQRPGNAHIWGIYAFHFRSICFP